MRLTRIDIEGDCGRAVIFRSGDEIVVNVARLRGRPEAAVRRGIGRDDSWLIGARDAEAQWRLARRLQRALDGARGTNSMVNDYYRELQRFAD